MSVLFTTTRFVRAIILTAIIAVTGCGVESRTFSKAESPEDIISLQLPQCDAETECPDEPSDCELSGTCSDENSGGVVYHSVSVTVTNNTAAPRGMTVFLYVTATSDISGATPIEVVNHSNTLPGDDGVRTVSGAASVANGHYVTMRVWDDSSGAMTDFGMAARGDVACAASVANTPWGVMPSAECH